METLELDLNTILSSLEEGTECTRESGAASDDEIEQDSDCILHRLQSQVEREQETGTVVHESGFTHFEVIAACDEGDHALSRLLVRIARGRYCFNVSSAEWMKCKGNPPAN